MRSPTAAFLLSTFVRFTSSSTSIVTYPSFPTISQRNDYCERAEGVLNGTMTLATALKGVQVSMAIDYDMGDFYMKVDNSTGTPTSGLLLSIHNSMANFGGFSISYILVPSWQSENSLNTFLSFILPYVDMYGGWFADTSNSRSAGFTFSQQVIDGSLILVTLKDYSPLPAASYYFIFLSPFSNELWFYIILVILANSLVHWILDRPTDKKPVDNAENEAHTVVTATDDLTSDDKLTLKRSLYLSVSAFAMRESMYPISFPSRFLAVGYSFFVMIVIASYTANLAQILISTSKPHKMLHSMVDANIQKATICALSGSPSTASIANTYRNVKFIYPGAAGKEFQGASSQLQWSKLTTISSSSVALLDSVRSRQCQGALIPASDWKVLERTHNANPDCTLVAAGPPVRNIRGAFPMLADYSTNCTAFLETALSAIIVQLQADGSLDALFQEAASAAADEDCSARTFKPGSMTPGALAGNFIIYTCMLAIAAIGWIGTRSYNILSAFWKEQQAIKAAKLEEKRARIAAKKAKKNKDYS